SPESWTKIAAGRRCHPQAAAAALPQKRRAIHGGAPVSQLGAAMQKLHERKEWKLVGAVGEADPGLGGAGWVRIVRRGVLPAVVGVAMGVLVGAVRGGGGLAVPLTFAGAVFVLLQVLAPIHQAVSANLGDRTAAWLYDRLGEACVRPPGMGHL